MGEMLDYDRGIAYVLMQSGMHCVGCPSSIHESSRTHVPSTASTSTRFFASIQEYPQQQKGVTAHKPKRGQPRLSSFS